MVSLDCNEEQSHVSQDNQPASDLFPLLQYLSVVRLVNLSREKGVILSYL